MIWLILSFLFSIDFVPPNKDSVIQDNNSDSTCKNLSTKYIKCVSEVEINRKISRKILKKEEIAFMNGCVKEPEEMEECFLNESGSCEIIFFCVQKKFIRDFKKEKKF
ncbi:MAG: Cys-rich protein [Leptospiraceae bacterium]|nr:Cys-rich protein [Leptospiraceae bacterium]